MSTQDENDKTHVKTPQNNSVTDRTQFAPPKRSSVQDAQQEPQKTQIKPRPDVAAPNPPVDKTRIVMPSSSQRPVPRPAATQPVSAGDKTQFANKPSSSLETKSSSAHVKISEQDKRSQYGMLKNRFVLEDVLGAGGMGVVYKAKDLLKIEAQDREPYVAIKVLSDEFKSHPEAFLALQRESRKTQKIAHPNIVNVHDFDRDGDTVFMTMEYLEGKPLDKLIAQHRSTGLPPDDAFKIIEGISAALIYAHGQNIIHSDFKPGNIFVNSKGLAKVFDFGIARAVAKAEHREESQDDRTVFDAGNLGALTPAYASLEMLEGATPDVRDDIYALGCIAYELYTGKHPFNRMHADEANRQKVKVKKIPGIKKQEWKAISRALALKRENRIASVDEFWREFTKKPSQTGKVVFLILLLMGIAGGAFYKFKPAEKPGFSEADVKSQIERKLRLEYQMKEFVDLYKLAEFSSLWEEQVWMKFQELQKALGKEDPWILKAQADIYSLYVKKIESVIAAKNIALAQTLVANARRYGADNQQLTEFDAQIAQLIEDKRKQEEAELLRQQQAAAQPKPVEKPVVVPPPVTKDVENAALKATQFDTALVNVNKQLECVGNIDMKDLDIAITKLRSVDNNRYLNEEPKITASLAVCIEKMGASFPDRAEESKKYALRLFKNHPTILAIKIVAKDQCSVSLAGLGARGMSAVCRDKLNGATKAPALVVIPAKGSIKEFAIGKFEVSVDEMNEYCQQTKNCTPSVDGDTTLPVTGITLSQATGYLKWLTEKSNKSYRLPSAAEWQYAAKAESGRVDPNRNCKLNSRGIQKGDALIKASIGQPNSWGLVNYLGNAAEWVVEPGGGYFAMGASFETAMEECDLTSRVSHDGHADPRTGFRVLRELTNN